MSFKENMIIVVLLRNEGVNKIKVVIYYLNNCLWYGIMYLWILWKIGVKMLFWYLDNF